MAATISSREDVFTMAPVAPDSIAPVVSARTVSFHFGTHHAYYLDWQNARTAYVNALVDGLLNWSVASGRFA